MIVVRLLVEEPLPWVAASACGFPAGEEPAADAPLAIAAAATVVDICELCRECPGLIGVWRESRVDSDRFIVVTG